MKAIRAVFIGLYLVSSLLMIFSIELAARNPGFSGGLILVLMPVLGLITGVAAFIVRRYFEMSIESSRRDDRGED